MNTKKMYKVLFVLLLIFGSFSHSREISELDSLPRNQEGRDIKYGYELLSNTAAYIGPNGSVRRLAKSNMSCTNCHLEGGTKHFGNSWLDTHGLYPQFKSREGYVQSLAERVNVCLENNSDSKPLAENSREMKSVLLYYRWLNQGRPSLAKDNDQRLAPIEFLERAADIEKGKVVYTNRCALCHQTDGQGKLNENKVGYLFPPLWGKNSFVDGSSSSRLSVLARFIKTNMPYEKLGSKADLTTEEAWDVAAYVLSKPRGMINRGTIFPDLKLKPYDFPFGPYADKFSLEQHRLGPFKPIIEYWKSKNPDNTSTSLGI